MLKGLTPGPLLQMTKTTAHLLSLMRPDFSFFPLPAARHLSTLRLPKAGNAAKLREAE
jgi:hypothetical protein